MSNGPGKAQVRGSPETEIAKPVLVLLTEMGFDLYQEVPLYGGGQRADIVGVLAGKTVAIVECKAALSFDVIAQAKRWDAHWRWVAVPAHKGGASDGRRLAMDLCGSLGVGVIEIRQGYIAEIRQHPSLRRQADVARLLAQLRPEHKTYAEAGSNQRFWSPWRDTVQRLVGVVQDRPGIPLRELIADTKHHWASNTSARSCFSRQIAEGLITELRIEVQGKQRLVFPVVEPPMTPERWRARKGAAPCAPES